MVFGFGLRGQQKKPGGNDLVSFWGWLKGKAKEARRKCVGLFLGLAKGESKRGQEEMLRLVFGVGLRGKQPKPGGNDLVGFWMWVKGTAKEARRKCFGWLLGLA